ncbi:hypothetical protein GCM10020295_17530 [Streptomyces cinereospinus]
MRAVTEKGIELGTMQTIRDPERAAERDRVLLARRAASQKPETLRFPGLGEGLLARASGPGRGELSVQGAVDDGTRSGRLDQVVGDGFHVLVDPALLAGADDLSGVLHDLAETGVRVVAPGGRADDHPWAAVVRDVDGTYRRWFAELGVSLVAVRPDFYVFGTAAGPDAAGVLAREVLGTVTGADGAPLRRPAA